MKKQTEKLISLKKNATYISFLYIIPNILKTKNLASFQKTCKFIFNIRKKKLDYGK